MHTLVTGGGGFLGRALCEQLIAEGHRVRSLGRGAYPELEADMLVIAGALVENGADVNDGYAFPAGSDHRLSALYGAIGHANNMALGRWLLQHGADPNDGESLYHSVELGHHEGLRMLLQHGADPKGTNALLRAMDFDDIEAVRMLLAAGHKLPLTRGLVGEAAQRRQTVLVPDVQQRPEWVSNRLLPETAAEIAVPILLGNELKGVVDVQHHVLQKLREEIPDYAKR